MYSSGNGSSRRHKLTTVLTDLAVPIAQQNHHQPQQPPPPPQLSSRLYDGDALKLKGQLIRQESRSRARVSSSSRHVVASAELQPEKIIPATTSRRGRKPVLSNTLKQAQESSLGIRSMMVCPRTVCVQVMPSKTRKLLSIQHFSMTTIQTTKTDNAIFSSGTISSSRRHSVFATPQISRKTFPFQYDGWIKSPSKHLSASIVFEGKEDDGDDDDDDDNLCYSECNNSQRPARETGEEQEEEPSSRLANMNPSQQQGLVAAIEVMNKLNNNSNIRRRRSSVFCHPTAAGASNNINRLLGTSRSERDNTNFQTNNRGRQLLSFGGGISSSLVPRSSLSRSLSQRGGALNLNGLKTSGVGRLNCGVGVF